MGKDYDCLDSVMERHKGSLTDAIMDIGENVRSPNTRMDLYIEMLGKIGGDTSTINVLHREMRYTGIEIREREKKLAIVNLGIVKYAGKLEKMAITDGLTGLYNRRFFNAVLNKEIARVNRGNDASLIIADIDNFKLFNDNHGHLAGDEVLSVMGKFLKNEVRKSDIVCRYGGEEFGIILPNTDEGDALDLAYKLKCKVANYPIESVHNLSINISAGADQIKKGESIRNLVDRVDSFLYEAKKSCRNCVVGKDGIYNPTN